MQPVSLTSRLKDLFTVSQNNGEQAVSSTPNRFLRWHVLKAQSGGYSVATMANKIVGHVYELDDAESIVREHNMRVGEREDWFGH